MDYGFQHCHLERLHGVWSTILPSRTAPWIMVCNIASWNFSMAYGLKYCLLESLHGVRFRILPSGKVPWSMIYNTAFWNGSMEYDLKYCLLESLHGVWFRILPSGKVQWSMIYNIAFWNGSRDYGLKCCFCRFFEYCYRNFLAAPTYIPVWYVLLLFCIPFYFLWGFHLFFFSVDCESVTGLPSYKYGSSFSL